MVIELLIEFVVTGFTFNNLMAKCVDESSHCFTATAPIRNHIFFNEQTHIFFSGDKIIHQQNVIVDVCV